MGDRKQMRSRTESLLAFSAPGGALYQKGLSAETRNWKGPCISSSLEYVSLKDIT